MKKRKICYLFFSFVICFSCAPQIKVVPLSKEAKERNVNNGIPYYLPKPYLLITRNFESIYTNEDVVPDNTASKSSNSTSTTTSTPTVKQNDPPDRDVFSYQIIYLPDTSEKYGIKISRGTGTFSSKISIVDGWKFVGINLETDSKTAETIKGIGQAMRDLASLATMFRAELAREGDREASGENGVSDEQETFDQKDLVRIIGDKLKKSLTIPDAEILLYDLADLSKPVFVWRAPNKQ